ncbi:MAG: YfiR family protein [Desulfobulbaceae bacterium]
MRLLIRRFSGRQERRPGRLQRCLLCVGAVVLSLVFLACPARTVEPSPIPREMDAPSEQELKAIYLYNFLQFVQWPKEKCPLPGERANEIVVIGDTSLQPVLQSLQAKLREKNKELILVFHDEYREGMDLASCSLLFIGASERKRLAKILQNIDGKHVLTVADNDEFVDSGVMITLLSRENKIRWAVNRKPVADAGLKMSAKLLAIAERVIE